MQLSACTKPRSMRVTIVLCVLSHTSCCLTVHQHKWKLHHEAKIRSKVDVITVYHGSAFTVVRASS